MFMVIVVGSLMIIATVIIESFFISIAVLMLERYSPRITHWARQVRTTFVLSALTLWLLAGISIALWLWAGLFFFLGEFTSIEEAIYFSTVSATTLGYGDLILSPQWRLLSGFIAANGLVLFSLNTAILFEVLRRLANDPTHNYSMQDLPVDKEV